DFVVVIAGHEAADIDVYVFVTVVVDVAEGYAVAFLQMARASRRCHIGESLPRLIAEGEIRHERRIRWRAGSEVNIEKAVVVQVAEVRAHRRDHAVQPDLIRHVLKSALAVIVIELHRFGPWRQSQETASDFGHRWREAGHKEIEPSVIVIIEEP